MSADPADPADLDFWATRLAPCPYLPDRRERKILTRLEAPDGEGIYNLLIRNGFRRSHAWAYRPHCPGCSACVPVRVEIAGFSASRNMRRVRKRNRGLRGRWQPATATDEQFSLFRRYVASRHEGGDMADMGWTEYRDMIDDTPVDSRMVEWRDKDRTLRAAMLCDRLEDGLSAVYSFFDPEHARDSLGTFMVLDMITRCRAMELPYLYLGYWVEGSPKMAYKVRFQPLQAHGAGGWHPLNPSDGGAP